MSGAAFSLRRISLLAVLLAALLWALANVLRDFQNYPAWADGPGPQRSSRGHVALV